jgi:hypothetical protein
MQADPPDNILTPVLAALGGVAAVDSLQRIQAQVVRPEDGNEFNEQVLDQLGMREEELVVAIVAGMHGAQVLEVRAHGGLLILHDVESLDATVLRLRISNDDAKLAV